MNPFLTAILLYALTSVSGPALHMALSNQFGEKYFYYPSLFWYSVSIAIYASISGSLMYAIVVLNVGWIEVVVLVVFLTASTFLNSVFFPGFKKSS